MEGDFDLTCTGNDMAVCENKTVARDNETRATALTAFAAENTDVHHARRDPIHDGGDRFRIGVEKLTIPLDGRSGLLQRQVIAVGQGADEPWSCASFVFEGANHALILTREGSLPDERRPRSVRLHRLLREPRSFLHRREVPSSLRRRPFRFSPSPGAQR